MLILMSKVLGKEFQKWSCSGVGDSLVVSTKLEANVKLNLIVCNFYFPNTWAMSTLILIKEFSKWESYLWVHTRIIIPL